MHMSTGRAPAALAVMFALAGCGGGGGGGSQAPPPPADSTPDAFTFAERANVVRGAAVISAPMTVSGINVATAIGIVGGEYAVGGAAYTSNGGSVVNGAVVTVRVTASTTPGGAAEGVLTIGGVAATFRVTTSSDVTPPTAAIVFPPPVARTGGATTTVRGTAVDASGPLAAVRVNGVLATTTNGFATWTAVVPLDPGPNPLTVTAEDGFLNVANAAATAAVQRNARLGSSGSIALDAANGRAFVTDGSADAVIAIDLATRIRTTFSDLAAPALQRQAAFPIAVVLDAPRNRLLVLDAYDEAIVAIDLTTKQRSVLSGRNTSSGPRFELPSDLALDSARNRVLVVREGPAAVIAVDLDSGVRTVLSDATTPSSADMFTSPSAIAIDAAHGRALVADGSNNAIYAVALDTGARSVLSSSTIPNANEPLDYAPNFEVDVAGNRALVPQIGGRILAVDLSSGERTLFSTAQNEPVIFEAMDLAIDSAMNRVIVLDHGRHGLAAVDLDDGTQSILSPNDAVSGGVGFLDPFGVALDLPNRRILVADEDQQRIVSVDLATAVGTVLVDGATGPASFARPRALALDSAANRLFVLDHGGFLPPAVIAVNLATGARSVLSGPAQPNGVLPLMAPQQMALDAQRVRLLVTERDDRAVKAVDTVSGLRTIVSSDSVPDAANPFAEPLGIVVDAARDRALIASSAYGPGSAVFAMNLATGARSVVVANNGQLTGPKLLALDAARNRALVADQLRQTLFAIDLATGALSSLTDADDPDNPIDTPNALAYDPATQIAYIAEWNFAAILAVDLVTGRRVYLSH